MGPNPCYITGRGGVAPPLVCTCVVGKGGGGGVGQCKRSVSMHVNALELC